MQTLNVGAGRTDEEYRADQERRRSELRGDIRGDANFFFVAAALALLNSGLAPIRLAVLVNVGFLDLLTLYGGQLGRVQNLIILSVGAVFVVLLVALGFASRQGWRWPFILGLILYGADTVALIATFSIWAVGVHGFFLMKWYQGQRGVADLRELSSGPS